MVKSLRRKGERTTLGGGYVCDHTDTLTERPQQTLEGYGYENIWVAGARRRDEKRTDSSVAPPVRMDSRHLDFRLPIPTTMKEQASVFKATSL